ncbi:alpha/beta fold hydrolase [Algoriphagus terrigena]|uniref:alpha/beta fold hydrolase n=1 Tax=Algoriphagus terrigena TaxID=344884 RepID=UPI0003FB2551|nr:alpha/beta hydrolase [Algoriphagus terrigena]
MKTVTQGRDLSIPINYFNLSYDDLGEGDLPIIFLHGFPFDKSMWQEQLEALAPSYRVIACDIRGFGKSRDEVTSFSIDLFSIDLARFMNALGIKKAIICGLSMGGYIALNFQKKYPELVEALILCDTQCISDPKDVKEGRLLEINDIEENGPAKFNEKFIRKVFYEDSLTQKKEVVEELKKVVDANSTHIIAEGLRALSARTETCSSLSDIPVPTLIICGREDQVTPLAQSEFMHRATENSYFRVIDKAGHVSNLEQPEIFNQHLKDFLAKVTDMEEENRVQERSWF